LIYVDLFFFSFFCESDGMEIDIGPVGRMLQLCDLWQFCKYDPPTPQEVILSGRHSGHIGYVNARLSA
jgi:hypothetical protein